MIESLLLLMVISKPKSDTKDTPRKKSHSSLLVTSSQYLYFEETPEIIKRLYIYNT